MPKLQEVVQGLLTVISGLDFGFNFFSHSAYFWCKRPGRKRVPVRPRVFDWWGFEFFTHGKWKVVGERAIFLVQRWSVTWLKTGGWGSVSHLAPVDPSDDKALVSRGLLILCLHGVDVSKSFNPITSIKEPKDYT